MVRLQLEDPLELFVNSREFLSVLGSISSKYGLSCWERQKHNFLPDIFGKSYCHLSHKRSYNLDLSKRFIALYDLN